jgi:hypothetical protein
MKHGMRLTARFKWKERDAEIDDWIVRRALDALKGLHKSPNNRAARVLARLSAENLEACLPENVAKMVALLNSTVQLKVTSGDAAELETVRAAVDEFLGVYARERGITFPLVPIATKNENPLFVVRNIPVYCSDMTGPADFREVVAGRLDDFVRRNREPIPDGVYYAAASDNFFTTCSFTGMGEEFYTKWHARREEFPVKWELQDHLGCSRDIVVAMSAEDAIAHYAVRHDLSSSQLSHWRAVRW